MHDLAVLFGALASVFVLFVLACLVGCKRILTGAFGAGAPPSAGLGETFARVKAARAERGLRTSPELLVIHDPFPYAWSACAPFRRGTVAVSEGLLRRCDEKGVREVIEAGIAQLEGPGVTRQSVCAAALCILFRLAPRGWVRGTLVGGSVGALSFVDGVRFLFVLPWIRFFMAFIRRFRRSPGSRESRLPESLGLDRLYLPSSIDKPAAYAGCLHLYVVDPWSRAVVFPLFD